MYNRMKLPFFGLNVRLLFTDLFWIRIQNVYFGSGSDPDPAKSFGSFRIRFRIRNTVLYYRVSLKYKLLTSIRHDGTNSNKCHRTKSNFHQDSRFIRKTRTVPVFNVLFEFLSLYST
jgi:hypothetical protein